MADENERDPLIDDDGSTVGGESRASFVSELVRKMAVAGMGAVFMGEEGLRTLAGQLKLPKELLGVLLSQAEKTKGDISRVVSEELRRFLQSEKLRDEVLKLLSGMTVELKAEVRLVPNKKASGSGDTTDDAAPETDGAPTETDDGTPRLFVSELTARRDRRPRRE